MSQDSISRLHLSATGQLKLRALSKDRLFLLSLLILICTRDMSQRKASPSEGQADKAAPPSAPPQPPDIRRTNSNQPLPGLNTTASSIRNRLPSRSSLSKVHSSQLDEDDDDEDEIARIRLSMDPQQLEELKKGIIMPGMTATNSNLQKTTDSTPKQPSNQTSVDATPRTRLPATLKASVLKGRHQAALQTTATNPTSGPKGRANLAKGTPARATRYSLPVRGEKPVRTSKTSGKHVMLPSESQLAPLPDEEDDDDDDDDDDDESSESSEEGKEADDEEAAKVIDQEEERLQSREEAKKRREEAQRSLEARREEKAAQKMAKKPAGAPGYPSSARFRGIPSTGRIHSLPSLKGPAHARAPPIKPKTSGPAYHTFERLAPSARVHTPLPRLTSYAISSSIHLPTLIGFLRREHSVRPRLYDECVYVVYFKPLLPGFGRAEVRSAPEPAGASPGGESRREREIVEREESGYVGSYFAATNKDDEGDHIDDQGYIMGGEGEGEGQRSENRGRERQQDQGDLTETETEREGTSSRDKGGKTGDVSESETDVNMISEAEYEENGGRTLQGVDHNDETDSGLLTPRALQSRPQLDYFIEEEEQQLNEALDEYQGRSTDTEVVPEEVLSHADVEGAMDLQHQQHMIESGKLDDGVYSSHRGNNEVRFEEREEGQGSRRGSPENGSGSHRSGYRDDRRRRRDKESRRRRKPTGPNTASHDHDTSINMLTSRPILEALQVAELIILPYGVLVMYNLSEAEERSIINDVISSGCIRGGLPYSADDEETEAFHFCYDPTVPAPRIFNDFFTFRTSNHLLKLSLAHAIAQSTKLSVFEESMQRTLELTSHIPRELASSGQLKLKRTEALMLTGRLFKLRVDVNLTSNVLDTPELFWSEASLKALYDAIREYLEIEQRVQNLNERLAVGNDLLEVIHDHIGSQAMDNKTVIIIYLIVVALLVALGEVLARLVVNSSREKSIDLLRTSSNCQPDFTLDPHFEVIKQLYYAALHNATSLNTNALLIEG
jgi:uncharacterized Rmd1/YagE family protein